MIPPKVAQGLETAQDAGRQEEDGRPLTLQVLVFLLDAIRARLRDSSKVGRTGEDGMGADGVKFNEKDEGRAYVRCIGRGAGGWSFRVPVDRVLQRKEMSRMR